MTITLSTTVLLAACIAVLRLGALAAIQRASHYFDICHRSDPDMAACIKRVLTSAKGRLLTGIPELGLPAFDPLHIPLLEMQEGEGRFLFQMTMKDVMLHGLSGYQVRAVRGNPLNGSLWIDMFTPAMTFVADYDIDGRVLSLPIRGQGGCAFNFTGVHTAATVRTSTVAATAEVPYSHLHVDDVQWLIEVEGAHTHLDNLFNGDRTLGDTTNRFFNDNWKEVFEAYRHIPARAMGEVFKELANNVYTKFPLDELHPQ